MLDGCFFAKMNPLSLQGHFMTQASLTAHQSSSANSAHQHPDMLIIAKLKHIWSTHGNDPNVRAALTQALQDGQVTSTELFSIQASAAYAVAQQTKSAEAFSKVDDDPMLMQEAIAIKEKLDPNSLASLALDEILREGKVTKQEINAFRKAYFTTEDFNKLKAAPPTALALGASEAIAKKPPPKIVFPTPTPSFGRSSHKRDDER